MIDDEIGDTISLAIKGLKKAINKLLKRRDESLQDKSQHRIRRLVEHAEHIFIELSKKRRSLKAFLLWFRREWIRIEVDLHKYPVEILQHSLQHFLRCQDSFILLTSGECRHEYDTELAKATKFRSRLSTLQERDDGYTVLYKGTGVYSGYGFDEFNNEVVGIRALLEKALKRYHKSPWEYLERQGGTEILETLLDQHERELKEMQQSLQSLKGRMINDINKRLTPKNLKFATEDKMEQLSLSVQGRRIDLKRRAGSFQIEGPLLPKKNMKPEDWNYCALKFKNEERQNIPHSNKHKRRRVIADSDSDDDTVGPRDESGKKSTKDLEQTTGKSTGLVVRIGSTSLNTEQEDSLATIKNKLGVNVHDLEQAREILEEEDGNTNRILEQEKVVRLEKILNRVLSRDEVDENEVWDARECLRYAYMEAGNKYLWDSRVGCVEKAIDNFEKAKKVVETQSEAQQRLADGDSAPSVELNLLYLQGQAIINIGIAIVDSCHRRISTSKAKIFRAIKEFETALSLMTKIRSMLENDNISSSSTLESTSYLYKAKQLESLGYRWMGRGFWLISNERKSIAAFEKASRTFAITNLNKRQRDSDSENEILEAAAEAIYASCDLADRCNNTIEQLRSQSPVPLQKGSEMLDVIKRALNRYIEISESIENFVGRFRSEHFRAEYEISAPLDVISYRDEIIKRWNDVRSSDQKGTPVYPANDSRRSVKRSDIASSTPVVIGSDGRSKSIFSSDARKKRRYQERRKETRRAYGSGGNWGSVPSLEIDATYALTMEGLRNEEESSIKYRKWGDEILIAEQQKTKGKNGEKLDESHPANLVLAYPSIAPPLPVEYQFA